MKEDPQNEHDGSWEGGQGHFAPVDYKLEPISPQVLNQINRLTQRLVETEAALEETISGEVDAVIDPSSSAPILLLKAQDALRKSEQRFHRLITNMPALVFELTPNGTVLEVNEMITAFTGYTQEELIGNNWWETLCKDGHGNKVHKLLAKMQRGDVSNYELSLTAKSGEAVILELNSANYYDEQGRLERIVGLGVNITRRKETERAVAKTKKELEQRVLLRTIELRNASQRLETVLQSLPVAVMIADRSGRILEKNDMVDQIWGGDAPLSLTIEDYSLYAGWWVESGEKLKPQEWPLARAVSKGEIVMGERIDITRFDGSCGTIINSAAPIYDTEDKLTGAVVASLDITHQRELERKTQQIAAEAQRRAEQLDAVFTAMMDAVIVYNAEGKVIKANPAAIEAYGFDPTGINQEELVRKLQLRYPDGRLVPVEELPSSRALRAEKVYGERLLLTNSRGEDLTILNSASSLPSEDGGLAGAVVVWRDVSERERLLAGIEQERDKLRTLIDNMTDEVWFCDAEKNLVLANVAVTRGLGLEALAKLPQPLIEILSALEFYISEGEPRPPQEAPLFRSLNGESLVGVEELIHHAQNDELRYRQVNSSPLVSESGQILGSVAVVRDITDHKRAEEALRKAHEELEQRVQERTRELAQANQVLLAEIIERKQAEQTLRESEERYRLVIESVKEYAIFTLDPEGYVTSWNKGAQNIKGYTADEIIGENFSRFYPPEEAARGAPQKNLQLAVQGGRFEIENWRVRKDGKRFWANIVITPLRDEMGQLRGFSKVVRDMTRRKQADEALKRQTEFVKLLQEVAFAANQAVTLDDAMQFALDRICAFTGWKVGLAYAIEDGSKEELAPMHLSALSDVHRFAKFRNHSEAASYRPGVGLPGIVYKQGAPAWFEDIFYESDFTRQELARDSGLKMGVGFPVMVGKKVVGVLEFFGEENQPPDQDLLDVLAHIGTQLGRVVERKQAENALKRSEARFRTIFEGAAMGIELVDLEGHLLAWNPALLEILGYSEDELRRNALLQIGHPANVVANGIENTHLFKEMRSGDRDFFRLEQPYKRKDERVVWGKLSASLVRDINGQPQFAIGMLEDITERKKMEAELLELQRRLMEGRETERLHLAQELHDGPVQDLYGISYNLKAFSDSLPGNSYIERTVDLQNNLQSVVRTLRAICGELRPATLAPFGLEKAVRSHADAFQDIHPELTIGLDMMADGQSLPEPVRLALYRIYRQALNNVVQHAQARHVMVRFSYDAEQLMLEIQDDGRGFEVPSRWIDLARQGQLGLVGSVERAESIGGRLVVESKSGEGTTVRVVVNREGVRDMDFPSRYVR